MQDPQVYLMFTTASLVALGMVTAGALTAWRGWLSLKRQQLGIMPAVGAPSATQRIELADLKERIRKLEAIAAGVDL